MTIAELDAEILSLEILVAQARIVRQSEEDENGLNSQIFFKTTSKCGIALVSVVN